MPDGLLYGVEMSFTPTLFTLGTGFMLIAGRAFEITAAESVSISPGSGYARVYVTIDTGATATENSFDQVNFGVDYAASLDSFAELTQEEININQGAAVYQAEVAVLAINSSGVTAIERQMELVSPGAGTGAFAAIGVTYPAGSTVTVTDGKITYTAPNTSGGALFIIPYAATWIVTATDGTETATQSVEITTEGQNVSVELGYRLPTTYQEVEYIQGNGTSYIDTGLYYIGNASKVEIKFNYLGNRCSVFGDVENLCLYKGTNSAYLTYFGEGYVPSLTSGANSFVIDRNLVYDEGVLAKTFTLSTSKTTRTMTLFKKNGTTSDMGNVQISEFRCYENDLMKMELIPCYRLSDSVAGFWDRIGKKFLTNAGSGTFIVGADV